jgi:hypothetical protein
VNKPDVTAVLAYLGADTEWTESEVTSALAAEEAAQAKVCRIPALDSDWSADLAEALCRRVVANLARRNLPLGLNVAIGEAAVQTTRVGMDQEVRRLEGPYRRLVVG